MALNIDSLVINRAIRGTLFDKTNGDVIFTIDQIQDPSLECTGEQADVVDALGKKITSFDRSKEATLTGSNALINLGLAAAQFGSDKVIASADNKITVPRCEELVASEGKVTLRDIPSGDVTFIYSLNDDGSIKAKYEMAGTAAAGKFSIAGKVITLPTDARTGRFLVYYDYESDSAISFANSADAFAKGGRFVLEVLLADICDPNIEYYAYVVFGNAKMTNEVTIDFSNEAEHNFEIQAMQDYCTTDKKLFEIIVAA